ncbi:MULTISPECIES: T9SS type A sorting domain-containing protein [Aequorivita]|uniref:T9SS type A sorting domain-containing protein n=1 Tax=Aequorivita iocasae TaxID=2803865 RepID=A0ABX7DRK9_9FLAO|nr:MULTISPECIES: T9SS type A sorting domain-containing protein [Aequorivita]QQX76387.1 T9SS type A sorting domain-containing protein [Aequorivita iocasae]UCA55856.1 T9SS type A sorting domain-containing protein [Aequorivita sp. F7]
MKTRILLLSLFLSLALTTNAQDGTYDPSFNQGSGFSGFVYVIKVLPNQKIMAGGEFSLYNNTPVSNLVRLNNDGTLDDTFVTGTGFNNDVYAMAVQADGKIIVAGQFTEYNGQPVQRVVRLLADGTLDTDFNTANAADDSVYGILLQPDGKIILYGYFEAYNSQLYKGIVRLNTDGSIDTSFNTGTGTDNEVLAAVLQDDGKVVIGGYFTQYNGIQQNRIARINPNGSLDTSFNTGTGADEEIRALGLQSDGKLLVGGFLNTFNGTAVPRIARLQPDGSLDATFNPGSGTQGIIYNFLMLEGDYSFATGSFPSYDGTAYSGIVRLSPDGSVDSSFDPGTGLSGSMQIGVTTALQADGKLLTGGLFTAYDNNSVGSIVRISNSMLGTPTDISQETNIVLYPIPVTDVLQIENNTHLPLQSVTVYDITGRKVFSKALGKTASSGIDLSTLTAGSYLCSITDGNRVWNKHFIKE